MAKSPRFASSRFVIIPEATIARAGAARALPRFCVLPFFVPSLWSDSKAGGKSLTHP
jgi:hypothetical protein